MEQGTVVEGGLQRYYRKPQVGTGGEVGFVHIFRVSWVFPWFASRTFWERLVIDIRYRR